MLPFVAYGTRRAAKRLTRETERSSAGPVASPHLRGHTLQRICSDAVGEPLRASSDPWNEVQGVRLGEIGSLLLGIEPGRVYTCVHLCPGVGMPHI